jgi:hypothetical protein
MALHGKSADEMWTNFKSRLDELMRTYIPIRTMNNRQRPLWMTQGDTACYKQEEKTLEGGKERTKPGTE